MKISRLDREGGLGVGLTNFPLP